jgi:hypothetical protein
LVLEQGYKGSYKKQGYEALAFLNEDEGSKWWWSVVWKWKCSTKNNIFVWLVLANKVLTWDNLQRRGWQGPNRCPLCEQDLESINHLFVTFPITKLVWQEVLSSLNCCGSWNEASYDRCLWSWLHDYHLKAFKEIPTLITWGLWLHRNQALFEGIKQSSTMVVHKIRMDFA